MKSFTLKLRNKLLHLSNHNIGRSGLNNKILDKVINISQEQISKIKVEEKKLLKSTSKNWSIESNEYDDIYTYRILCDILKDILHVDEEYIEWYNQVFYEYYHSTASGYYDEFPDCIQNCISKAKTDRSKKALIELISILIVWCNEE